jgi:hypothetical protein
MAAPERQQEEDSAALQLSSSPCKRRGRNIFTGLIVQGHFHVVVRPWKEMIQQLAEEEFGKQPLCSTQVEAKW